MREGEKVRKKGGKKEAKKETRLAAVFLLYLHDADYHVLQLPVSLTLLSLCAVIALLSHQPGLSLLS